MAGPETPLPSLQVLSLGMAIVSLGAGGGCAQSWAWRLPCLTHVRLSLRHPPQPVWRLEGRTWSCPAGSLARAPDTPYKAIARAKQMHNEARASHYQLQLSGPGETQMGPRKASEFPMSVSYTSPKAQQHRLTQMCLGLGLGL